MLSCNTETLSDNFRYQCIVHFDLLFITIPSVLTDYRETSLCFISPLSRSRSYLILVYWRQYTSRLYVSISLASCSFFLSLWDLLCWTCPWKKTCVIYWLHLLDLKCFSCKLLTVDNWGNHYPLDRIISQVFNNSFLGLNYNNTTYYHLWSYEC